MEKVATVAVLSISIALFLGWFAGFAGGGARSAFVQTVPGDSVNNPQLVRAARDGSLLLTAENGKGVGPDIKYMPEWKAFGWFTAADRVEWDIMVKKADEYDVFLSWSVSDEEAGKPFILEVGDTQIRGAVGRTGSWETFRTEKIGRIQLAKGRQKVVFKPASDFRKGGALLDLRALKFVRVD
ncbi:MAG TPA: hypothetical protein VKZ75_05370 [Cyclobacteriaceae bacterium]|nr:hypothetical protein [Cyclobacteriaceae bacterium]